MKRLAAILLLGLMGFNWCGYRLFSAYLENRADRQLEARLDENQYDDSQLLSIKVPAHLSYSSPSLKFERVDGQVEVGAVLYKYVKRRIYNDSVELLCIPNHAAMGLQTARNEFFQLVNDLPHNGQSKKTDQHPGSTKSPTSPDYINVSSILVAIGNPGMILMSPYKPCDATYLSSSYSITDEQPPDQSVLQAWSPIALYRNRTQNVPYQIATALTGKVTQGDAVLAGIRARGEGTYLVTKTINAYVLIKVLKTGPAGGDTA